MNALHELHVDYPRYCDGDFLSTLLSIPEPVECTYDEAKKVGVYAKRRLSFGEQLKIETTTQYESIMKGKGWMTASQVASLWSEAYSTGTEGKGKEAARAQLRDTLLPQGVVERRKQYSGQQQFQWRWVDNAIVSGLPRKGESE